MIDSVLVQNGRAHEVLPNKRKTEIVYHPDLMAQVYEVDGGSVAEGYVFDGTKFLSNDSPPVEINVLGE
jgi:hypothetical protein